MKVSDLTKESLLDIVSRIRSEMWPDEDPELEWSPDTLDVITQILDDYGVAGAENPVEPEDGDGED